MPKKPLFKSKAAIGASVQYCGHQGTFIADIFDFGSWVMVKAASGKNNQVVPVTPGNIDRNRLPTHVVMDSPVRGGWCPERGVFVVPRDQLIKLKNPEFM